MDKPTDLHVAKASHMSVPVTSQIEFHLTTADVEVKTAVGKHYWVSVPCICTSMDKGNVRFKQEGALKVAANPIPPGDALLEALDQ